MASYTSRFVQLTDYCLLEYMYTVPTDADYHSDIFWKIVNSPFSVNQIINVDSSANTTYNVQENSCIQTGPAVYTYLDKDQLPTYLTYSGLPVSPINSLSCDHIPYDQVRFHLVSGYDFGDLDGIMFRIAAVERSGREVVFCDLAFSKTSENFQYSTDDIFLNGRLYNRYVMVLIPSVQQIQANFTALAGDPGQALTLAAQITSDGMGFRPAQPIRISATEIKFSKDLAVGGAHYTQFQAGSTSTVTLNQFDEFSLLGAHIAASTAGDYYEYFATWNGAFINDWILAANTLPGNQYVILHELRIIEQVGSNFIPTFNLQSVQEDSFDVPNLFRPVILNAAFALAFTIEYTMRLYNKADSSQIIRVGTLTDFDPKAWGQSLLRLYTLDQPQTFKIFNKVVAGPTLDPVSFINTVGNVQPYSTVYIPSFFDRMSLSVSKTTIYLDANGQLTSDIAPPVTVVYGQHQATIQMSPFDNFFKFTLLKTDSGTPTPLNLGNSATYNICFIDDSGNKVRFPSVADPVYGDHTKGDLLFKVSGTSATAILNNTKQEFWITSMYSDGDETVVYQGNFAPADQALDNLAADQAATTSAAADLAAVATASAAATTAAATTQANSPLVSVPGLIQVAQALTSAGTLQNLSAVEIPGLAQSIVVPNTGVTAGIKPVSYQKIPTATVTATQPVKQTDTGTITGSGG